MFSLLLAYIWAKRGPNFSPFFRRFKYLLSLNIMPFVAPSSFRLRFLLIDFHWKNLPYTVIHIKFASPIYGVNFSFIFALKISKALGPISLIMIPVL